LVSSARGRFTKCSTRSSCVFCLRVRRGMGVPSSVPRTTAWGWSGPREREGGHRSPGSVSALCRGGEQGGQHADQADALGSPRVRGRVPGGARGGRSAALTPGAGGVLAAEGPLPAGDGELPGGQGEDQPGGG